MDFEKCNLLNQEIWANPHEVWDKIRSESPVFWYEPSQCWMVLDYEMVKSCFRDTETFSAERIHKIFSRLIAKIGGTEEQFEFWINSRVQMMLNADGEAHSRKKKYVAKIFTPQRMDLQRDYIQNVVDELIRNIKNKKKFDFITEFAKPLPFATIRNMMGVSEDMFEQYSKWIDTSLRLFTGVELTLEEALQTQEYAQQHAAYLHSLLEKRKNNPKEDIISYLIEGEDMSILNKDEVISQAMLLMNAGYTTLQDFLGNAVYALFQNPSLLEQFRTDKDITDKAIDELLRFTPPFSFVNRIVKKDIVLHGKKIKKGDTILLSIFFANHDHHVFKKPHDIVFARCPNEHIAFGYGIHNCIGRLLALLEIRIALTSLFSQLPNLKLSDELPMEPNLDFFMFRGIKSLPMEC